MMRKISVFIIILLIAGIAYSARFEGEIKSWTATDFIGFDQVGDCTEDVGDITSAYLHQDDEYLYLRVSFADMVTRQNNKVIRDNFTDSDLKLTVLISDKSKVLKRETISLDQKSGTIDDLSWRQNRNNNLMEIKLPSTGISRSDLIISFAVQNLGKLIDEWSGSGRENRDTGNCAFVHHGNQGLTYTEVFYGSPSHPQGLDGSGFDEVLQAHEATDVPGNFHMSGTLMPAAEWHNPEFNDWLSTMVSEGTVSMMTSALGQHIMPFVQNNMNDWAVAVESDMVNYRYNYEPHIAWVPERVWLSMGQYPDAGIVDNWLGNNWTQHGVWGVVLDDGPHLNGYDNHKIHWMSNGVGIDLRVIPIDNTFVGNMHYDAGAAMNRIASMGQYNICVYGTDWEVAAEMNEHAWNGGDETFFLDNYQNVLWYCHDNYPGVNVWKLDDAIQNADFNGESANITPGTYGLLGGDGGYGGSNNSWYTDWAGTASHSDFHSPAWSYGYIWNNTYENLMNCPDNNLSQLGWYTLMINLHETGWHDSGEVSGWEHRYSSHIKNANVYAEASRWAAGQYLVTTNAYLSDIDRDGVDEIIMHNDKSFFVFESIGGRAAWVFAKDENGNAWSVVGSDVAYYSETDGDYNEGSNNHVALFSDVYPNYQNDLYEMTVLNGSDDEVSVQFSYNDLIKTATLITGNSYIDMEYSVSGDVYIKNGFTADLMDIIWNGKSNIQRMWGDYDSYCGRRNSASGATVAAILGSAGGDHNTEFEGTLVQGDEIHASGSFHFYLYAGWTSEPYDEFYNKVTELDDLAAQLGDDIAPVVEQGAAYQLNGHLVQIVTSEAVTPLSATNPDNYLLSGSIAGYNINSIYLTHGNRKIILNFSDELPDNLTGMIMLDGIEDFNGNLISEDGNLAELTDYITPHIVGTINGWAPSNHDYDLICGDNMLWSITMQLAAGTHEYKVTESNAWDGGDWPSNNQIIEMASAGEVTIWVNCGLMPGSNDWDGYVCQSTNAPMICGDFLSEMGGSDWDVTNTLTVMNDNGESGDDYAGDGIFSRSIELGAGDWEFKIVLNNNWDQNTTDGNLQISLDETQTLIFTYNFSDNIIGWHSAGSTGYGDIDNNGLVESFDAALVLQYFVGIDPPSAPLPWDESQQMRADVDGNTFIEAYDASLIQRFVVGMIDHFPVEEE